MSSIVNIACEVTKIYQNRVYDGFMQTPTLSSSQDQLVVSVHTTASPLLVPSALLGSFIPTPVVKPG